MNLTYADGVFTLNCSYDERFIAKNAGFRWAPEPKKWQTQAVQAV